MASQDKSGSVPESIDESPVNECKLCLKESKHYQANHFCQDCAAAICDKCRSSHTRFPALRNHEIVPIEMVVRDCGLCHAEGVHVNASHFCEDCDSWVCDSCKDSHSKFPDLSTHSITVVDKMIKEKSSKPSDISRRFSHLSTAPSGESLKRSWKATGPSTKPDSNSLKATTMLADKSTKPDSASITSSLPSTEPTTSKPTEHVMTKYNFAKTSKATPVRTINIRLAHDKRRPRITGCCFMATGELVLCDKSNGCIKLLNYSLAIVDNVELVDAHSLAVVDERNVIVTSPTAKRLRFVEVLPKLKRNQIIRVDKECWGVAVAAGKIFVSLFTFDYEREDDICSDDGEIRIYDMDGTLKKRIGINEDDSYLFKIPEYISVSKSGDKIYVSDWGTCSVTCITADGEIVFQRCVESEYRRNPKAIYVDGDGSVVVSFYNPTIEYISATGADKKEMLSFRAGHDFGMYACQGMAVRQNDGIIVIGCIENEKLFVLRLLGYRSRKH